MLTYNRPQFISAAIESIRAQTLENWELLVVHDGPNEEIPRVMGEWEKKDARIRYFRRIQPGNIAEASNFGLQNARGEYIAVLDDDDYWSAPDKLARQVEFLDGNPAFTCCGGGAIVVTGEGVEQMRYLKPETDDQIKRRALMANPLVHSTTMYRRSSALQVGGYDEGLAGFQDWDLWLKLGSVGKLYNFPAHLVCYRVWHGSGSFHQAKKNTESALRIIKRHRNAYPGFGVAYTMTMMYHGYAHLPAPVQRATYSFLSRMKKAVFAAPTAAPAPSARPAGTRQSG
jgi:glycosyltransferase involved in cell wall biosynthesis